jgi:hypothetical protein
MTRKTRKHGSTKGVYSIPELRRAFEHVEEVIDDMIRKKENKDTIIRQLRKEWTGVFHKTLDRPSAVAMVEHRMELCRHRGTRSHHGGAQPIAGAPLDYVTRPGIYLNQGTIPGEDGGLTRTVGGAAPYGSYVQYVDRGFVNPEIAKQMDPVQNQSGFPYAPYATTGSNAVVKGGKHTKKSKKDKKRGTRKTKGGAAMIQQAFLRPIPADIPTSPLFDLQRMINGSEGAVSPDQVQRPPVYHVGSVYPQAVNIKM